VLFRMYGSPRAETDLGGATDGADRRHSPVGFVGRRWRYLLARCVAGVTLLATAAVVGACHGQEGSVAGPGHAIGTPSPGLVSRVPVPSTSAITSATQLSCDDGTTGVNPPNPSTLRANGLTADGWVNRVLPTPRSTAAGQVIFWKAFLYAAKNAQRWTTVSIDRPATARLYYVPFLAWSTQTPGFKIDVSRLAYGQTAIAFEFCGHEPLGYPGGILTQGPACVTLIVHADGRPDTTVRLALGLPCA
jgi:hypothetical protein